MNDWNAILGQAAPPTGAPRPRAPRKRPTSPAPMTVVVGHVSNPDFDGGYPYGAPPASGQYRQVPVSSLAEAVQVCRNFIAENDLGGGNLGLQFGVVRQDGKAIAKISYNGRVWGIPPEYASGRDQDIAAVMNERTIELDPSTGAEIPREPRQAQVQATAAMPFEQWLATIPTYSGELLLESEWLEPRRWPDFDSYRAGRAAAQQFAAGRHQAAAQLVLQAMEIANGAVTRREGRRGMSSQRRTAATAQPQSRTTPMRRRAGPEDDFAMFMGDDPGGEPAGMSVEMDMPVTDTIDGGDFADLLEEPGDKAPVDLSKKDVELLRSGLESKLELAEEDEAKLIKGLLGKMKGIGNAVLTPMDEEEDREGSHEEPDGDEGEGLDDELVFGETEETEGADEGAGEEEEEHRD